MKKILGLLIFTALMTDVSSQNYAAYPAYKGTDLGLTYTPASATFRIWSPPAEAAQLLLYKEGTGGIPFQSVGLTKGTNGTWYTKINRDLKGVYYAFRVMIGKKWNAEVPDPYVKSVGVNGKRGVVLDLKTTNPQGWANDKSPAFSKNNKATDAVIYELHIRDASIDPYSGVKQKGTFNGLAETGTHTSSGTSTGLSHIRDLGVTHVHLLPFFDYNSVDESQPALAQYNWGYDPLNYNVPEGSYSSNAADGATRIRELKQMIQSFHRQGLRVIMDAVYNHTGVTEQSNFNQLVPGYYYRHKKDGSFSDATACGNETASEMPMMRKFMLESVLYWVKEYHIDGFRFDLMGVHDIETMNLISRELHKIKPDIVLYGEGWTAGESPLPDDQRALKKNAHLLDRIAVFSDDIRDGIKGSVFDGKDRGFATGKAGMEESVKFGIVAAGQHNQVDYSKVNYSKAPYTTAPWNVITYCECHDNNTLWDKIVMSVPDASAADHKKMHRLALSIVLTSQGIPFLHAGTEFFRTKYGVENSYKSGDSINMIRWEEKEKNKGLYEYVKKLIGIRKAHPAFRMQTEAEIQSAIRFMEKTPAGVIAYTIDGAQLGDTWKKIIVAFNGTGDDEFLPLPPGNWTSALTGETSSDGSLKAERYGTVIVYQ